MMREMEKLKQARVVPQAVRPVEVRVVNQQGQHHTQGKVAPAISV
jgi:hypothetical protein